MEHKNILSKFALHPLYSHIGNLTSQRCKELSLTLETLSIYSNISIPDLHRIESGQQQITALQLFHLSHALYVPISFFFTNYAGNKNQQVERLVEAFGRIREEVIREEILGVVEVLGNSYP